MIVGYLFKGLHRYVKVCGMIGVEVTTNFLSLEMGRFANWVLCPASFLREAVERERSGRLVDRRGRPRLH